MTHTPRTLGDLAIDICADSSGAVHTKRLIRDYLAQWFAVAYLEAESDGELKRLEKLWTQITGEKREVSP
jgi:hypothetical protein